VTQERKSDAEGAGAAAWAAGELPVWIGFGVGASIAGVLGTVVGVYAGIAAGLLSLGALAIFVQHVERSSYVFACETCRRELRWGNWRKKGTGSATEG